MRKMMAVCLCLAMLGVCVAGHADRMQATDAILTELERRFSGEIADIAGFFEAGDWVSTILRQRVEGTTSYTGIIADMQSGTLVAWDDLFADGDAAADRIEGIVEAAMYDNAYAETMRVSPVPRDSFAVREGQLFIFYPAEQFLHFSGEAGAIALYAYELDGLLLEGVPLQPGDISQAKSALGEALGSGALPGMLSEWTVGRPMTEADEMLGLVDVPDIRGEFAVWHFEAPQMRGVALLSGQEDEALQTAAIQGIHAQRMDFSGLQTGVASQAMCIEALGEPDTRAHAGEDSPYALVPAGEALSWASDDYRLTFHFVQDVLYSMTLLAR